MDISRNQTSHGKSTDKHLAIDGGISQLASKSTGRFFFDGDPSWNMFLIYSFLMKNRYVYDTYVHYDILFWMSISPFINLQFWNMIYIYMIYRSMMLVYNDRTLSRSIHGILYRWTYEHFMGKV